MNPRNRMLVIAVSMAVCLAVALIARSFSPLVGNMLISAIGLAYGLAQISYLPGARAVPATDDSPADR